MKLSLSGYLIVLLTLTVEMSYSQSVQIKQLADSLYQHRNWITAKNNYQILLGEDSSNAVAWNRLGYCNQNLGLYSEAIDNYNRAINNKPPNAVRSSALFRLSMVYSILNDQHRSQDFLLKATALGFNTLKDLDTLAAFKNLRGGDGFESVRQQVYKMIYPCSSEPRNRDFDFWIGDWNCYQYGTEILSGVSHVEEMAGGCAILENYTSIQAYSGKSFNYYDTVTKRWEQQWIGSGGASDRQRYYDGEYKNGTMHFLYEITDSKGAKTRGNFIFYHISRDSVRQYQDVVDSAGKTSSVTYDLIYRRK